MERLTKLDKYGQPYTNEKINCRNLVSKDGINYQYVGYVDNFKAFDGKPIEKLSKLEDLEDDLGIPLEVLFKALKDGIYVQGEDEDGHLYITKLENYKIGLDWCKVSKSWGLSAFATKDYGKTWALTREELEDAKD